MQKDLRSRRSWEKKSKNKPQEGLCFFPPSRCTVKIKAWLLCVFGTLSHCTCPGAVAFPDETWCFVSAMKRWLPPSACLCLCSRTTLLAFSSNGESLLVCFFTGPPSLAGSDPLSLSPLFTSLFISLQLMASLCISPLLSC